MAYQRMTDDYEPEDIPYTSWEECERRGDYAHPGRYRETDENHEEEEDEAF